MSVFVFSSRTLVKCKVLFLVFSHIEEQIWVWAHVLSICWCVCVFTLNACVSVLFIPFVKLFFFSFFFFIFTFRVFSMCSYWVFSCFCARLCVGTCVFVWLYTAESCVCILIHVSLKAFGFYLNVLYENAFGLFKMSIYLTQTPFFHQFDISFSSLCIFHIYCACAIDFVFEWSGRWTKEKRKRKPKATTTTTTTKKWNEEK